MGTCEVSLPNQLILTSLAHTVFKLSEFNWLRLILLRGTHFNFFWRVGPL